MFFVRGVASLRPRRHGYAINGSADVRTLAMTEDGAVEDGSQRGRRGFITSPPPIPLTITPRAQEALVEVLRLRPRGSVVHLTIVWDANPHPTLSFRPPSGDQLVFEHEGIPLVVEPNCRPYLAGCTVDHVVEEGFASFEIRGPNLPRPTGPAP